MNAYLFFVSHYVRARQAICCVLFFLALLSLAGACGGQDPDTNESRLVNCQKYFRASNWNKAVELCSKIDSDEAKRMLYPAYIAQSGLDFVKLAEHFVENNSLTILKDYIPQSTAKEESMLKGWTSIASISQKETSDHIMMSFVTAMLIFNEHRKALGADFSRNPIITCLTNTPPNCTTPGSEYCTRLVGGNAQSTNNVNGTGQPGCDTTITADSLLGTNKTSAEYINDPTNGIKGDYSKINLHTLTDANRDGYMSLAEAAGTLTELQ